MFLVFEILTVLILFVSLIYGIKYILLLSAKRNTDKSFCKTFDELLLLYEEIITLFSLNPADSFDDKNLVGDTKKLISEAKTFSIQTDSNERIIAYANTILENTKTFTDRICEKEGENLSIKNYNKQVNEFNKTKELYNSSAIKLKYYVDVFPTSLFARLKDIKTVDFLN